MLFELPDDDTLYQALLDRDARYDGQAWVCVSSTRIFCRLTCPARKPRRENCRFVATIAECVSAGFRPCRRCSPMQAAAAADPTVINLLTALDASPDKRWSEQDVKALGFDLSTVRRSFKRQFGVTFLELARQCRLRNGFNTLANGGDVIAAQHEARFDSPGAFRAAFARLIGRAPGQLPTDAMLRASWIATPLGDMIAVADGTHLHLLEFVDRRALPTELAKLEAATKSEIGIGRCAPIEQVELELAAFFDGSDATFGTPLAFHGSAFSRAVWRELQTIPVGETRSYSDIARAIGQPTAVRAVARANGANMIALLVPCHRVIGADGSLTGYGGGLWRKQRLLEIERALQANGTD